MKKVVKIALLDIPPPLESALREQASFHGALSFVEGTEADLLLSSKKQEAPPGSALLTLSWQKPLRLGALLQRMVGIAAAPHFYLEDIRVSGSLFKPQERAWQTEDGREIPLTDREVEMLAYFIRHHGKTVLKEDLLRDVWNYQEGIDTHTVETHVYRLRQKIEPGIETPSLLATTDKGYILKLKG